jgi:hypothetical protein
MRWSLHLPRDRRSDNAADGYGVIVFQGVVEPCYYAVRVGRSRSRPRMR